MMQSSDRGPVRNPDLARLAPVCEATNPLFEQLAGEIAQGSGSDWRERARIGGLSSEDISSLAALHSVAADLRPPGKGDRLPEVPGYELLTEIGRGSYGRVYRARDRKIGRLVALKMLAQGQSLPEHARAQWLREARIVAAVDHPNIVRLWHLPEQADGVCLAMELIEGHTLSDLVAEIGWLDGREAMRIGSDLCHALRVLHRHGVIHGDLKPANVMREHGGRIVLLDFGMAHSPASGDGAPGAPAFTAPEAWSQPISDPRSDIYSLGVLLYWLVAGKLPYRATDLESLRAAVHNGDVVPLPERVPDVPRRLLQAVDRALQLDPDERPANAMAMARLLESSPLVHAAPPEPVRSSTGKTALALLASVLLAVAALVWLPSAFGKQTQGTETPTWAEWITWDYHTAWSGAPHLARYSPKSAGGGANVLPELAKADRRVLRVPADFNTIQAAIDAVREGDIVEVGTGTWREALVLPDIGFSLRSVKGATYTAIDPNDGRRSAIEVRLSSRPVDARPLVIHGLAISGGTGSPLSSEHPRDMYGGALFVAGSHGEPGEPNRRVIVTRCTLWGNGLRGGTLGGGVAATGGARVLLEGCLIGANAAWACGGGVLADGAEIELLHCTVVGNGSSRYLGQQGGAAVANSGSLRARRCIFWGNQGLQVATYEGYDHGTTLDIADCVVEGGMPGEDIHTDPPRFAAPDRGDFRLLPDSPYVDAARNSLWGMPNRMAIAKVR